MKWREYPAYRDSGVEWLREIPEHWTVDRLRRLSKRVTDGAHISPDQSSEDYPFVSIVDVKNGTIDFENCLRTSAASYEYFVRNDCRPFENDVLFSKDGTVGQTALVDFDIDFVVSSSLVIISPIPPRIQPGFLEYWLNGSLLQQDIALRMSGAALRRISVEKISRFSVVVPLLSEQESIVAFLDHETSRIDEILAKKQRQIELLQEKRSALISHVVTKGLDPDVKMKDSGVEWLGVIPEHWKQLAIKRLSIVKRGASPRPIDDPKYFDEDGEYSWVRIADVTASSRYLETTTQRLSDLGKSLSVPLSPGSLFISIAGTVGKPIIAKIKCCIHDGFVYFPQYKEDANFLYYIFASGQPYQGLGKWGTQLNLNTDTVGWIQFGLPPIDEQRAIAAFLDQETSRIDELIAKITQSIDLLREYRTALISAAVTGKIDIREEVA